MGADADRAARAAALPSISPRFLTLATALSLSMGVALVSDLFVSTLAQGRRQAMQRLVLDGQALMPYQYDMYLLSVVCRWLQGHVGLTPVQSFSLTFTASYVVLFLALWTWLWSLYRRPASVLIGLFALAFYACLLMPYAADHPADPLGAASIALTLAATARHSAVGIALASLAGGLLWSKHALVAPIVLLYEGRFTSRARGVALAALVVGAALVGPLLYRLPLNPIVPEGVLTRLEWLCALPAALVYHVGFALPPLLSLYLLRQRMAAIVRTSALLYPVMIAVYGAASFFIHELRSFWPVVPVFVALLAAWGEEDGRGHGEPPPVPERPAMP